MCCIEMFARKLKDRDVMPELDARSLAVTQHQGQRCLQHGLVSRLVSGFLVDGQIFARCGGLFARVGEELLYLARVHRLWF